ncbi:glycerate kinase type-2 family protein [Desulfovibrio sp. SGI.169]|uniref:glycerate kinase type-2 family protein n=1 Tax=Desulfovibrio sp. SGI.169 TaxID=3420561 RepID=UPI003D087DF6
MERQRTILRSILDAALKAVAPDEAILRHMHLDGAGGLTLVADGRGQNLAGRRVRVLGAGKGVAPMALALEDMLGQRIDEGFIVVKYDHGLPLKRIRQAEAGHPVPDESGVRAAARMLDMARTCTEQDLLICLLTGGASALTPAPAPGLNLADLQRTTQLLLDCGAAIHELNAVRKHLSAFSGGQLARAAGGASVLSVIVSDVVGDPLDVIASGPTAPDASSFADCHEILARFGLENRLPVAVREYLRAGLAGRVPETPKPGDALFSRVRNILAATNRQALDAAARAAEACGYVPCVLTDRMTGEARQKAVELTREARRRSKLLGPDDMGFCLLAGGETTVTIQGRGRGGRNQEMALAAALELEDQPCVCALFAGTDGTDGPTGAAGGFAFSDSVTRMGGREAARSLLDENDSNAALTLSGDLLITGPTRTNVMDLAVLLVERP